ncbi:O-methyltransferase family protein [Raphanus sativus]|nr:O-methyltransferase family protein [Raphanus sativus]
MTIEQQQHDSQEMVALQAERMVYSLTFPMVFKAALELGVIDTMATVEDGVWLSPSEIESRLPTKPTNPEAPMMLDWMMLLLASHSVLKCRVVETGENDQTGKTERVTSQGCDITRNICIYSAYGMKVFDYLAVDGQFSEMFDPGMSESSTMFMKKVLEKYKGFEDVNTLVDVGGGVGTVLGVVTSKYPHIKGINFDLASVLVNATTVLHIPWILHAWKDENCVKILKNCYASLPEKGKVIVVDVVMPTEPKCYDFASNMDLTMDMFILSQRSGGRERTLPQLEAIGCAAGFSRCEFICRAYSFSLIESTNRFEVCKKKQQLLVL